MGNIEPDPKRFQAFIENVADDQPIVMINLLRYREKAAYPAGSDHEPCSGREAYQRYGALVQAHLAKAGGSPVWMGTVQASPIAPEGEEWDDAILVRYPNKKAFIQMVSSPEYLKDAVHRGAALEDSRLICTLQLTPDTLFNAAE